MPVNLEAIQIIDYEKSFVAFLDVLGFKEMVFSKSRKDIEKLHRYFGIVNSVIDYLKTIPLKKEIGSIVISDSIILSLPQQGHKETNLSKLRQLFVAVGLIQKNLALKDIWLRGAITSGETYFDSQKSQVVGPAYINAFVLEQSLAVSPRVIIDSRIINEFEFTSASEFISEINLSDEGRLEYSNWGSRVLFEWNYPDGKPVEFIKNDISLFIDYLSPIIENSEEDMLTIIKNLEKNIYKDSNTYIKYRWVADYLKCLEKREQKYDNIISQEASYRLGNL